MPSGWIRCRRSSTPTSASMPCASATSRKREARFTAAIEIDPAFQVPYSGMARLHCLARLARRGAALDRPGHRTRADANVLSRAQGAHPRATGPDRGRRRRRRSGLLQSRRQPLRGRPGGGAARRDRESPGLLPAIAGDGVRSRLDTGPARPGPDRARRPAVGTPGVRRQDARSPWRDRRPHQRRMGLAPATRGELRPPAARCRGRARAELLRELLSRADEVVAEGVVSVDMLYWMASAHAVMGEKEQALDLLEQAVTRGWRHAWWARHDWNWTGLCGRCTLPRFAREGLTRHLGDPPALRQASDARCSFVQAPATA